MSFSKVRWLVAALIGSAMTLCAQQNILPDPGFEAPENDGPLADGWWVYNNRGEAHAVIDKKVAHSGKQSVRLTDTPEGKFVFLSPKLQVASEDEIAFSGWIRFDQQQNTNCASMSVTFRDRENRIVDRTRVCPTEIKPGQWILLKSTAKAPPRAAVADFDVYCSNLVGSVWADDVSAVVTSPLSMFIETDTKPWPGQHDVTARIVNRAGTDFHGVLHSSADDRTADLPIVVAKGSTKKFSIPVSFASPGQHHFSVTLLDANGNRQRAFDGHFKISEPLTVFPSCPSYINIAPGSSEVLVDAHIVVNPSQRAGLRLQATLSDAAGKQIAQNTADASRGEFAGTKLRVPTSAEGVYNVSVLLLSRNGAEIARGATDVHVRASGDAVVKVDRNGYLRVAGEPEFPMGMYSCSHYDEMASGQFNATHSYSISAGDLADPINATDVDVKRLLDQNVKYHLRMMVELPRHAVEKAQWAQVRRRIETFRNHPGLLCWGSEERVARGEAPLKNTVALYKLVHELDPNHPLVLGDTRDVIQHLTVDRRNFFPDQAMDVGIWWWYPIPLDGADGDALAGEQDKPAQILEPPSWLTTTVSKKPLWIAIQSYQKPKLGARFPTPAEYRCMSYLSIINKARGLWFYTGSGQKDYYGRPAGLLNKPEEAHWDYVQKLVRELHELSPVIMSPMTKGVSLAPANPAIEFSVHDQGHKLYVLAANKTSRAQTAHFTSDKFAGKQTRVLYEEHTATLDGETLTDTFEPFGVHVYCVE